MKLSKTQENRLLAQVRTELDKSDRRGESKLEAKVVAAQKAKEDAVPFQAVKGIFATSTYNNYQQDAKTFIHWAAKEDFYSRNLADYFPLVKTYFDTLMAKGSSLWTVRKYISGLCCVFRCHFTEFGIEALPPRRKDEIKRTRTPSASDARYKGERHDKNRAFLDGTGARAGGFHRLRPDDVRELENGDLQVFLREKGGKERWALVLPEAKELVREMMSREPQYLAPNGEWRLVSPREIPRNMTCHSHRAIYAQKLYRLFEERGYANGKLYHCRGERKGEAYDKGILAAVAVNLGHGGHRYGVVVNNYLN